MSPPPLLCSASALSIPHHCFPRSHILKARAAGDDAILSSGNPQCLRCSPYGFRLASSLSLARYADIPPFSRNQRSQGLFSFTLYRFPSLEARAEAFSCLKALVMPRSLLNLADSEGHCFLFFSSTPFASLLTLVFRSFSSGFTSSARSAAPASYPSARHHCYHRSRIFYHSEATVSRQARAQA